MEDFSFCVHGHFYQPAREDPITGQIPDERGAVPFRNWNELIFSHCYRPNAELGNFERISFNMGPTLLNWMEQNYPETLESIIQQDRVNFEKHGVGNALAQPYHHTILPLATYEDKVTQIKWGIEDFVHRFGHQPSGMWLPETAVDMETLSVLVDQGIEFTILAPWQADTENLDVTQPYWVMLPERRKIAVFFYHQGLSTRVSFDPPSTSNADLFATDGILPSFNLCNTQDRPKYLIIASDGELYGHHQPFRDKFLAHLMNGALSQHNVQHIYPALWLKKHPPIEFIRIRENTSWSCHHGVKRWSDICDCTGNSAWKLHLRKAIELVAKIVDQTYFTMIASLGKDGLALRNDYIDVVLNRIDEDVFIHEQFGQEFSELQTRMISRLLRGSFERQRMYTSCGWFFDDFDRIEPQNVVAYAAQAFYWINLVHQQTELPEILAAFDKIISTRSAINGREVFVSQLEKAQRVFLEPVMRNTL
jgi:alpha-amylase/alpha-mannosidase (GH57 family)